jgi:hypothetical protein
MVAHSRAPVRVDRLRSLNLPRRVVVDLDGRGFPGMVTMKDDRGRAATSGEERPYGVEAVGEVWRVDDEWWRQPVSRRYVEVILEGGAHVVLFEDLITHEWFVQRL